MTQFGDTYMNGRNGDHPPLRVLAAEAHDPPPDFGVDLAAASELEEDGIRAFAWSPAGQVSAVDGTAVYRRRVAERALEEGGLSTASSGELWISSLRASGQERDHAVATLHELLLRAARFELSRRRAALSHVRGEELEDIATQAADDALMAVLAKLDHFRGASRFTTWAYKFALLEAGVKLRRRAWQGREIVLAAESWPAFADKRASPHEELEQSELLHALRHAITGALTPHQREVFIALALNDVPIDVLAERLTTTRGALYKTLHDARRKLRRELSTAGFAEPGKTEAERRNHHG